MLMKKEVIEDNEKLKEQIGQLQLERDTAIAVAKERKQAIEDIQRKLDIEKLERLKFEQEYAVEKQAYIKMYNMYVEKENIINELEKWLYDRSEFTNFGVVIDKLQELKGSDKE